MDATCSVCFPYSGKILGLNEGCAWILAQLDESPLTTQQLAAKLGKELGASTEMEIMAFLESNLTELSEEASLIRFLPDK
ncbi:MAG: hypothetical protein PHV02_09860 [Rhodocyclaceae bacterium]|nr:hypothetical protein [Rhodocyclaceae bacterium]